MAPAGACRARPGRRSAGLRTPRWREGIDRILTQLRARIRARQYVMTVHAEEEMDADGLSLFDIESAVLTGRIVARQWDRARADRKYAILGRPPEGDESVVVVARIGPTGKVVFLTVHVE